MGELKNVALKILEYRKMGISAFTQQIKRAWKLYFEAQ